MRQPRIRSVASGLFATLTMIACAIGCASWRPSVRPIGPGEALRPNEGLLVLHVRTEWPLRSISISGSPLPVEVARGTHLSLIAVSAGRHRWSGLGIPERNDSRERETVQVWFSDVAELRFRIEAGRINYAGMLEVYDADWDGVSMRSVDRTAFAIEELRAQFPALMEQYPIVYSGPARHVFLERFLAAKSARSGTKELGRGDPR